MWKLLGNFKNEFMDKYFQIDVLSHKEIELLERKHGNMIVADYAAKFEELSRFCPHYNIVEAKGSKCVMRVAYVLRSSSS